MTRLEGLVAVILAYSILVVIDIILYHWKVKKRSYQKWMDYIPGMGFMHFWRKK